MRGAESECEDLRGNKRDSKRSNKIDRRRKGTLKGSEGFTQ